MKAEKKDPISYLPLIAEWEKYLGCGGTASVGDFAAWVVSNVEQSAVAPKLSDQELQEHFDTNNTEYAFAYLSPEASFLLWKLYKYLRFYSKDLFRQVGLANHDEFAILAHIDFKKECSKKVAIEENMIDLTTGVDIIKRLINRGLLNETVNPKDRREKMLTITETGRSVLQQTYIGFSQTQDLLAELSKREREHIVGMLTELDSFHSKNYQTVMREK